MRLRRAAGADHPDKEFDINVYSGPFASNDRESKWETWFYMYKGSADVTTEHETLHIADGCCAVMVANTKHSVSWYGTGRRQQPMLPTTTTTTTHPHPPTSLVRAPSPPRPPPSSLSTPLHPSLDAGTRAVQSTPAPDARSGRGDRPPIARLAAAFLTVWLRVCTSSPHHHHHHHPTSPLACCRLPAQGGGIHRVGRHPGSYRQQMSAWGRGAARARVLPDRRIAYPGTVCMKSF